ncbi:site-specific integrase [Clostridium sporogenes]|uniref:site-specific integrase n=1 Tax=Clostridium sporogenes TaxID=1509 RepID=UPI0006695346|nr:site-specific integrase [Clostridium sporogenes]
MNTVEPIRDMELIYDIADYLKLKNERDYVMFMVGINTGLRISDILNFRVRDIKDKDYFYIREKKTNKEKRMKIHKDLKIILNDYIKDKKDYEFLFKSKKGLNKPITRQRAYTILKDAAEEFGLDSIGCHTLRKTFGYHLYKKTKDAITIKEILNHSSISVTLRYIGINQDRKDNLIEEISFVRKR